MTRLPRTSVLLLALLAAAPAAAQDDDPFLPYRELLELLERG